MPIIVERRNVPGLVERNGDVAVTMIPEGGGQTGQPPISPIIVNVPPSPPAPPTTSSQTLYTEEQLNTERERIRQEEKNKLYPTIESLQATVSTLNQDLEARRAAETAAQQRAADEERQRQEAEMTALERFQAEQTRRDGELATLREDVERERALRVREAELTELERYKAGRIIEEGDNISPDLVQFIVGNNQEQVEQAITRVKASSAAIVAQTQDMLTRAGVAPAYPPGQGLPVPPGVQPQGQQVIPGLPVSGAPPVDMAGQVSNGQRTLTAEEIRNMPMDEYRQYRDQILAAGSQRVRQYGPYAP
jgi:hypothetical protein